MEHTIENNEPIRDDEILNSIINDAVDEVIATFNDQMLPRDKDVLLSVIAEIHTPPTARVVNLSQLEGSLGVSPDLPEYVRQVFATLQQKLNPTEQKLFVPPFSNKPIFETY